MSECLRRELMLYGIDVIVIGPGAVATPIWDKAEGGEYGSYRATSPKRMVDRLIGRQTGLLAAKG
jgi:short-subunit dehydrogenase